MRRAPVSPMCCLKQSATAGQKGGKGWIASIEDGVEGEVSIEDSEEEPVQAGSLSSRNPFAVLEDSS